MKRKLKQVTEGGKIVWRITEHGERVDAPCEKVRRAKEKALRVTAELEAERIKINQTEGERHEENRNQP